MWTTDTAVQHYRALGRERTAMVAAARKAWKQVEPGFITDSWNEIVTHQLMPYMSVAQPRAASLGASYSAGVLADQGMWVAPRVWVDPTGFAGINPRGGNLQSQLLTPAYKALHQIKQGASPADALLDATYYLLSLSASIIMDTARIAAGIDITGRPRVGYVRVVHPSACSRCVILAGKFYRWNKGFLRHPQCRCEHEATTERGSEGMFDDPYEVFDNLSREQQDRKWGAANAEAIRQGADIYQVTNANKGVTKSRMFTTSGTYRGYASTVLKPGQRRLTPEGIYRQSGGDREKAYALLKEHGYVLPGGQVPGGVLRGNVTGYGQFGKGGAAAAAKTAMEDAVNTGVRDPRNRYTMTAAERRLYDAEAAYRLVLEGKNPFASPGFGNTPDPYGEGLNNVGASGSQPLTPQIAAMVEKDYRRWLTSNGEVFTK